MSIGLLFYSPDRTGVSAGRKLFMIAGVGYDIFPIDWERVRNIANLEEGLLPLVGDVKVLYSASEEDLGRFRGLQVQMKDNLADKQKSQTADT